MKLTFKERGSKEFYDEFLYIASRYNIFLNKDNVKVKSSTKFFLGNTIISLVFLVLFIILYCVTYDMFMILFSGIFLFLALFSFIIYRNFNKRIKAFMNEKGTKTIEFNKECVSYDDSNKTLKMNNDKIAKVIVGKYAICILSKDVSGFIISIPIEYKEKVIKHFEDIKLKELIVDAN